MASTVFGRGAHTMNSFFSKPVIGRKAYHKKGSSSTDRHEGTKMEGEEVKGKRQSSTLGGGGGDNLNCDNNNGDNNLWVPHQGTGIYYPKGHEKVMQDVPPKAAKDMSVNWFSH